MARPSKEQSVLKGKAVNEAFEALKESSTATVNLATLERIVDLANERYAGKLDTNISYTSLKAPTNEKFKEVKAKADKFREDHGNSKKTVPKKSKQEIMDLKEQRDGLVVDITKYEHRHLEVSVENEELHRTVKKLRHENSKLIKKLEGLGY